MTETQPYLTSADTSKPRGTFSVRAYNLQGDQVAEFSEANLIVDVAKDTMARLISEPSTNDRIARIGFGTSGLAPTPTDTTLTEAYTKPLNSFTREEGSGSVTFHWTLGYGEANLSPTPMMIREYALITASGELFAKKVKSGIEKDPEIYLEGEWTIEF